MKSAVRWALALGLAVNITGAAHAAPATRIPAIGCPSDGQVGPQPAPHVDAPKINLSPAVAKRLAFYKGDYDPGVLAPRGWKCLELEGSNGSILIIALSLPSSDDLLFFRRHIEGPGVELIERSGETSGRFEMAQLIARVFPAHMDFADKVIAENIWNASEFPSGPYRRDRMKYRGDRVVEFETPAGTKGLGSWNHMSLNTDPISGAAFLDRDIINSSILAVRLPKAQADLKPIIIRHFEAAADKPSVE